MCHKTHMPSKGLHLNAKNYAITKSRPDITMLEKKCSGLDIKCPALPQHINTSEHQHIKKTKPTPLRLFVETTWVSF